MHLIGFESVYDFLPPLVAAVDVILAKAKRFRMGRYGKEDNITIHQSQLLFTGFDVQPRCYAPTQDHSPHSLRIATGKYAGRPEYPNRIQRLIPFAFPGRIPTPPPLIPSTPS